MFSGKIVERVKAMRPVWQGRASWWLLTLALSPLGSSAFAEMIDSEELKDPTRPSGAATLPQGSALASGLAGLLDTSGLFSKDYSVSFIRAGGAEPVAMINQQLVSAGDKVGDAQVLAIDSDSVSLRIDGEVRKIMSFSSSVKSRAETP